MGPSQAQSWVSPEGPDCAQGDRDTPRGIAYCIEAFTFSVASVE